MKATRAEEIMKSAAAVEVHYRNNPVWIETVDKGRNAANVTYLEKGNTVEVSITQLEEKGPVNYVSPMT
ncbi:MAG: H-type small acid-soluble spore protein [Veillonellales bacterium]